MTGSSYDPTGPVAGADRLREDDVSRHRVVCADCGAPVVEAPPPAWVMCPNRKTAGGGACGIPIPGPRAALIRHPAFGSLWLTNARIEGVYVVGEAWDDSGIGSALMPDDFRGEPETMNFPAGCVAKWVPA